MDPRKHKPVCVECQGPESAYKCPRCSAFYCSVTCCQSHKKHCGESVDITNQPNPEKCGWKRRYVYEYPSEDTVPLEKLLEVRDNEQIKELLKSAHLRALITKLDDAQNPKSVMKEIMKDPEFRAYSNLVIEINGVKDQFDFDS